VKPLRCPICRRRTWASGMCAMCGKAFDRWNRKAGTTAELIEWVARRARRFARTEA